MATNPNTINTFTQDWRQSCAAFLAAMRQEHPDHETPPDENGHYAVEDLESTIARGPTRRDVMCSAVAMSSAVAVANIPTPSLAGDGSGSEPELWPLWLEWKDAVQRARDAHEKALRAAEAAFKRHGVEEAEAVEDRAWEALADIEYRMSLTPSRTMLGVGIKIGLWRHLVLGQAPSREYHALGNRNIMVYSAWEDALKLADCHEDILLDGRRFV